MLGEAIGFSKWLFQLIGGGANTAGYQVQIFGTLDPAAYTLWAGGQGKGLQTLPVTSWFPLEGPSSAASGGAMANPMVSGTAPIFTANIPLVAVRLLASIGTAPAPTAEISVLGFVVP